MTTDETTSIRLAPIDSTGEHVTCGLPGTYAKGHRDPLCEFGRSLYGLRQSQKARDDADRPPLLPPDPPAPEPYTSPEGDE